MKKHLFYFAFETPKMNISNSAHNDDSEVTEYFYISAISEAEALKVGTTLANEFLSTLYKNRNEKILAEDFAHGLLGVEEEEFDKKFLDSLPYFEQVNEENKNQILNLLLSKYIV